MNSQAKLLNFMKGFKAAEPVWEVNWMVAWGGYYFRGPALGSFAYEYVLAEEY